MPARPKGNARRPKAKPKPRPRSRKRSRAGGLWRGRSWLISLGLALGVAGIVLGWLWATSPTPPTPKLAAPAAKPLAPPPTYPAPSTPPTPAQQLQALDEALIGALRVGGVEPGHLRMRFLEEPQGEVTLLLADLKPGQEAQAVEQALDKALRGAKAVGAWQRDNGKLVLRASLGGKVTHQVSLELPASLRPQPTPPQQPAQPAPAQPVPEVATRAPRAPSPAPPLLPRSGEAPLVAIVIDDVGYQPETTKKLIGLNLDLTFSVLPHSPHGRELAEAALAKGRQVLVHLPMEPHKGGNLGPGGLLGSMSAQELARLTREDLEAVPGAVGANNHMGSLLTENPQALQPVMETLAGKGFFFLDSVTSARSQAMAVARRVGLVTGQRDVFLDHDPGRSQAELQISRLIRLAGIQGRAIAIGHPHQSTLEAISAQQERLRDEVRLVPVSRLLSGGNGAGQPASVRLDSQPDRQ